MPIPAIALAAAYVGGQLGGAVLGNAVTKKLLPSQPAPRPFTQSTPFDLHKELERLGFPTTGFEK